MAGTVAREAWDFNDSLEWVSGVVGGIDRRVWRALAIRSEVMMLRVAQQGDDSWLRGVTLGTRARWGDDEGLRPLIDVAGGVSDATTAVPPGGTRFNYLAVIGAGVEKPWGRWLMSVTGRWLHASNAGREGARNPDIQSIGVVFGVGWEY